MLVVSESEAQLLKLGAYFIVYLQPSLYIAGWFWLGMYVYVPCFMSSSGIFTDKTECYAHPVYKTEAIFLRQVSAIL